MRRVLQASSIAPFRTHHAACLSLRSVQTTQQKPQPEHHAWKVTNNRRDSWFDRLVQLKSAQIGIGLGIGITLTLGWMGNSTNNSVNGHIFGGAVEKQEENLASLNDERQKSSLVSEKNEQLKWNWGTEKEPKQSAIDPRIFTPDLIKEISQFQRLPPGESNFAKSILKGLKPIQEQGEWTEEKQPMFIQKLMDFTESKNPWDLVAARYLFVEKTLMDANEKYDGVCRLKVGQRE